MTLRPNWLPRRIHPDNASEMDCDIGMPSRSFGPSPSRFKAWLHKVGAWLTAWAAIFCAFYMVLPS